MTVFFSVFKRIKALLITKFQSTISMIQRITKRNSIPIIGDVNKQLQLSMDWTNELVCTPLESRLNMMEYWMGAVVSLKRSRLQFH